MGLSGQAGDAPTSDDALETLTLGNSDNVNLFILGEDRVDSDFLLKERLGKVYLSLSVSTSVDLDLHNVCLLDAKSNLLDLSVGNHTDNGAELSDAVKLVLNILSTILLVLESVLGVSLLLGLVPVLVATTLEFLTQMLRKDSRQSAESVRSLNVSNNTDNDHGRSFNDGNGVNNLTLVHERTRTIDTTDHVGHTGLVTAEGSQVAVTAGSVLGEMTNATLVVLGALLGQETQVTVSGSFELSVRPVCSKW
jgi:hypothetical protein